MRSRNRPRPASAEKIPYRPELRHLALVAVCARRLIRHPGVGAISGLQALSSCAAAD